MAYAYEVPNTMGSALEQIQPVAPPMSNPGQLGMFGNMGIRAGEQVGQMPSYFPQAPSDEMTRDKMYRPAVMPDQKEVMQNQIEQVKPIEVGKEIPMESIFSKDRVGGPYGGINPAANYPGNLSQFFDRGQTLAPAGGNEFSDAQFRPEFLTKGNEPVFTTMDVGQTLAPPGGQAPSGGTFYQAPSNAPYQSQSQTGLAGFVNPGGGIAGLGIRPDFSGGNSGIGQMYSPPNFDTQSFMSNTSANAAPANGANPPGNAAPAAKGVM